MRDGRAEGNDEASGYAARTEGSDDGQRSVDVLEVGRAGWPSLSRPVVSPTPASSSMEPLCLGILLGVCRLRSSVAAVLHSLAVYAGLTRASPCLSNAPAGLYHTLREIWLARLASKILKWAPKTPLCGSALALVACTVPTNPDTGQVIAICHTPWAGLLAEWCRRNDFALVLAEGRWIRRSGHVNVQGGVRGLLRLVRHLRGGGRAVVVGDVFSSSRRCSVRFLGSDRLVSLFPARLAAAAGVPLLGVVPRFESGQVRIGAGPQFSVGPDPAEQRTATRNLLAFFEHVIRQTPAVWSDILKHQPAKGRLA